MYVCMYICLFLNVIWRVRLYLSVLWVYIVYLCGRVSMCVRLYVAAFRTHLVRPGPITETRTFVCWGPDTLTIRRPTHEMIRRFVLVRAVKTRWRFGSKTVSFHVSACYYVISLFTVVSSVYMLLLSFHVND